MSWPAAFTSIPSENIWPHAKYGKTNETHRVYVQKESKYLDEVADINVNIRESGGKFFISDKGCFYRDERNRNVQFVTWIIED